MVGKQRGPWVWGKVPMLGKCPKTGFFPLNWYHKSRAQLTFSRFFVLCLFLCWDIGCYSIDFSTTSMIIQYIRFAWGGYVSFLSCAPYIAIYRLRCFPGGPISPCSSPEPSSLGSIPVWTLPLFLSLCLLYSLYRCRGKFQLDRYSTNVGALGILSVCLFDIRSVFFFED